jgi:hypothetical protein
MLFIYLCRWFRVSLVNASCVVFTDDVSFVSFVPFFSSQSSTSWQKWVSESQGFRVFQSGEEAAIGSWVESWEIFSTSLDHASKILYPSSSSWTSTASCLDITLVTVPIKDYISKVRTILPRTRCCGGHVYPKHGKWRLHVGCVSQCPFTVPIDMVTRTCLLLYVYIYIYVRIKHIWGHEDPLTHLAVILGFLRMACMY